MIFCFSDMRKCNFCSSDSNGDKILLKLKPAMLEALGIQSHLEYHACEDHFDTEAMSNGKRRRWANNARLNATIEDIQVDRNIIENMKSDHAYSKELEEEVCILDAKDLNMGKDFFCDSQSISCLEEVIDDCTSEDIGLSVTGSQVT